MRLVTSKNRAIQKYLETLAEYGILVHLKLAQQRGLQFSQTRSNAVILHDTLPAEFIEKAICMKTKDQLYQRESVILRPRVLKANSQSGSQDLPVQEARSSWESEQDVESCGETRSSTADYRVPGFSISTWNCRMHGDKITSQKITRCSKNSSIRNTSLKTWVKSRRSVQWGITTITRRYEPNRDLRTLQVFCKTSLSSSTSGVLQ